MSAAEFQRIERRLRWASILYGLLVMVWLPFEDRNTNGVLFFALGFSGLLGGSLILRSKKSWPWCQAWPRRCSVALSALSGLLVTPVAIFWMAFKNGLHGHTLPEFSLAQIRLVLYLTPVWLLAGLLIGLGLALMPRRV